MANGGGPVDFSLMDVFANIIPGATVVALVAASLRPSVAGVDAVGLGIAELTALAVLSMVVGLFLQAVALVEEGAVNSLGCALYARLDSGRVRGFCLVPFVARLRSSHEAPATHFEAQFWTHCVTRFDLPDEFGRHEGDYPMLRRALLAHLESTPYSKASRMRALYQMSRGLWAGFSLLLVYYLAALWSPGVPVGVTGPVLTAGVVAFAVLFVVFYGYKNMFHRLWFELSVAEFFLDRTRTTAS